MFLEHTLLCDEVEEILARLWSLHHYDERVVAFKVVEEADDARKSSEEVEKADFQGNSRGSNLKQNLVSIKKMGFYFVSRQEILIIILELQRPVLS